MYLDISSNQGAIMWQDIPKDVNGIILRATTKNNKLDVRTMENYNGILKNISAQLDELSVYKFSYAWDYVSARLECYKCLQALKEKGIHFDYLYLDLEGHDGRDYTTEQASHVIMAYMHEMAFNGVFSKFRLYYNYNYLKNIIDPIWRQIPTWLARYNSTMGDTFGANIVLWQYTSTGHVLGINGNVDISKEIT